MAPILYRGGLWYGMALEGVWLMDMVERVAREIAKARDGTKPEIFDGLADMVRDDLYRQARAAIGAMINADGPMAEEGAAAVNPYTDTEKEYTDNVEIALDVYQAMVRAALK